MCRSNHMIETYARVLKVYILNHITVSRCIYWFSWFSVSFMVRGCVMWGCNGCWIMLLSQVPKLQPVALITDPEDTKHYDEARQCVEELALYLKPLSSIRGKCSRKLFFPERIQHRLLSLVKDVKILSSVCSIEKLMISHNTVINTLEWDNEVTVCLCR